jgi:hypothetical protein
MGNTLSRKSTTIGRSRIATSSKSLALQFWQEFWVTGTPANMEHPSLGKKFEGKNTFSE